MIGVTTNELPAGMMRMFSTLGEAEAFAQGKPVYFVATNKTYYAEAE